MSSMMELKHPIYAYVNSLWLNLFKIMELNSRDPIKAYELLKELVPLLPRKVMEEVEPLLLTEREAEEVMRELSSLRDGFTIQLQYRRLMREELRRRTRKILRTISLSLERMGLKYRFDFVPVGGVIGGADRDYELETEPD
jgi:hypothetical protein